jgi:hypothetical protein
MNSKRRFNGFDRSFPIEQGKRRKVSLVLPLPRRNSLSRPIPLRPKSENPKGLDLGIQEQAVKPFLLQKPNGLLPLRRQ